PEPRWRSRHAARRTRGGLTLLPPGVVVGTADWLEANCRCPWRTSSTPCRSHSHDRTTVNSKEWNCVAHEHITDQPPPIPTDGLAVWDLVIEDMKQRDQ